MLERGQGFSKWNEAKSAANRNECVGDDLIYPGTNWTRDRRSSALVALFAVLGAVVGAILFGRIGFGSARWLCFGLRRRLHQIRGPSRASLWSTLPTRGSCSGWLIVVFGIWCDSNASKRWNFSKVEILGHDAARVDHEPEWAKHEGQMRPWSKMMMDSKSPERTGLLGNQ